MNRSFVLVAAGVSLAASVGWGAAVVGAVSEKQGKVSIMGAGEASREPAVGDAVYENDRVITKSGSKVRVQFVDGTTLDQGENGDMQIDRYAFDRAKASASESHMTLTRGTFRVNTGQLTKVNPDGFKVQTRMATIGIRGSDVCFVVPQWGSVKVYTVTLSGPHDLVVVTREPITEGPNKGGYVEKTQTFSDPKMEISVSSGGTVTQISVPVATLVNVIRFAMPDNVPMPETLAAMAATENGRQPAPTEKQTPADAGKVMIQIPVVAQPYEGQ